MSESVRIALESRTVLGKKVKTLRRAGILPATVYGKGVGPFSVQLQLRTFQDAYRRVGRTKVIELAIPGQPTIAAFVHALQRHPVSREIIHVDFHAVDLKVAVTVAVPVHLVGASPLVARGDALLNQALSSIEVSSLPMSLPTHIDVDVSGLDTFDSGIFVRDIQVPPDTEFNIDPETLVVNLTPIRQEVEEVVAEEEPATAEPELIRETREDEE